MFGNKTFLNGKYLSIVNVPELESIRMGYPSFKPIQQVKIESRCKQGRQCVDAPKFTTFERKIPLRKKPEIVYESE